MLSVLPGMFSIFLSTEPLVLLPFKIVIGKLHGPFRKKNQNRPASTASRRSCSCCFVELLSFECWERGAYAQLHPLMR